MMAIDGPRIRSPCSSDLADAVFKRTLAGVLTVAQSLTDDAHNPTLQRTSMTVPHTTCSIYVTAHTSCTLQRPSKGWGAYSDLTRSGTANSLSHVALPFTPLIFTLLTATPATLS